MQSPKRHATTDCDGPAAKAPRLDPSPGGAAPLRQGTLMIHNGIPQLTAPKVLEKLAAEPVVPGAQYHKITAEPRDSPRPLAQSEIVLCDDAEKSAAESPKPPKLVSGDDDLAKLLEGDEELAKLVAGDEELSRLFEVDEFAEQIATNGPMEGPSFYSDKTLLVRGFDVSDMKRLQDAIAMTKDRDGMPLSEMQERAVFDVVRGTIIVGRCGKDANPGPNATFLTGGAGSGKSFVLKAIVRVCERLGIEHLVVAHQGVAALNVGGSTIYSVFKPNSRNPFPPDNAKELKLVIIDEISMVSAQLLETISERLRAWTRMPKPFGRCTMLFVGDLMQLAPVGQGSLHVFESSLWRSGVTMVTLSENHRQSDQDFIRNLNLLRNGDSSAIPYFNGMVPSREEYIRDWRDSEVPHLMSTNRAVQNFNESRFKALIGRSGPNVAVFETMTTVVPARPSDRRDVAVMTRSDAETSLPSNVKLCAGTVIMFTRNDVGEMKFANGDIGVVEKLLSGQNASDGRMETHILVRLKRNDAAVVVAPVSVQFAETPTPGQRGQRIGTLRGYPIVHGWAITIHKSQGLSLDRVVVDPAGIFAPAQLYVALSRARGPAGLRLLERISYGHNKIDAEAKAEYARLAGPNPTAAGVRRVISDPFDGFGLDDDFAPARPLAKPSPVIAVDSGSDAFGLDSGSDAFGLDSTMSSRVSQISNKPVAYRRPYNPAPKSSGYGNKGGKAWLNPPPASKGVRLEDIDQGFFV